MMRQMMCAALIVLLVSCTRAAAAPDTILVNGKVFTSNPEQLWAEAVAIRGDAPHRPRRPDGRARLQ